MNRNTESHFSTIPQSDFKRSGFDRSFSHKTTFSSGKLVPIYFDEVLPGDTVTLDTSLVCRMTTPIFPVMDNCFLDIYYFFVPNRLVWEHWNEFMGEANPQSWIENPVYEVPAFYPFTYENEVDGRIYSRFYPGTLADYFGLPVNDDIPYPALISQLPYRAYYLVWNEFFRAQALQDPVFIPLGDSEYHIQDFSNYEPSEYVSEAFHNLALMPVGKFFDYFTSCLPSPQKGQPVMLPLSGNLPVLTADNIEHINSTAISYLSTDGRTTYLFDSDNNPVAPNNMYVDVGSSDVLSVNDLRSAITVQHFLEMEARGGSRYTEIIKTFFGVTSPDARLQRPEYLGGTQIPINIDQVVQTSANDSQPSPLGNTGAFSLTGLKNEGGFTYSATEHGMILGLCCVRPRHTYQRGIEKKFTRRDRFDFYFPVFDNISEQPVMLSELNASLSTGTEVFGYQEAWADYRYSQNKVTGGFRYTVPDSLSAWVYTDTLDNMSRVIDRYFIEEDPSIIGDTLAYTANNDVQFLADFYFKQYWYRPMSVHSVPGLTRI